MSFTRHREPSYDIQLMESLLALLTTNEELAVMEMQRIRETVLTARAFMDNLRVVYQELRSVRRSEQGPGEELKRWRLSGPKTRKTHADKAVAVLLSPNVKLSGEVSVAVFRQFLDYVRTHATDVIIFGKLGRELFLEQERGRAHEYIDIPDQRRAAEVGAALARKLTAYDTVRIFHGRFINLVRQLPHTTTLAENPLAGEGAAGAGTATRMQFLFEPSVELITQFFDEQVAGALLAQILSESSLALLGSRITAIERSQQLVHAQLASAGRQARAHGRALASREQAERLAGMVLW